MARQNFFSLRMLFFCLSLIFLFLLLYLFPINRHAVAKYRFQQAILQITEIEKKIVEKCTKITTKTEQHSEFESWFISYFSEKLKKQDLAYPCTLSISYLYRDRFHLYDNWNFHLSVFTPSSDIQPQQNLISQSLSLSLPLPLSLFPLGFSILSLCFNFFYLGSLPILFLFSFLLCKAIPIQFLYESILSCKKLLFLEWNTISLFLFWSWTQLFVIKRTVSLSTLKSNILTVSKVPLFSQKKLFFFTGLNGVWNPFLFSLFSSFYSLNKNKRLWHFYFFSFIQVIVIGTSLLCYSLESSTFKSMIKSIGVGVSNPKYFLITFILFSFLFFLQKRQEIKSLEIIPFFHWRDFTSPLLFLFCLELFCFYFDFPTKIPFLFKIGFSLLIAEIISLRTLLLEERKQLLKKIILNPTLFKGGVLILCSGLISVIAESSGLLAMLLYGFPIVHNPYLTKFIVFLIGFTLGFITGNIQINFLAIFLALTPFYSQEVIFISLEGLLPGVILSPYSLFNLIPSLCFQIPSKKLLSLRWKQIGYPLLISMCAYAISPIYHASFLQPIALILLCFILYSILVVYQTKTAESGNHP